jgi:predicted  nucleic acid-binding Zn-ribbon protein
MSDEERDEHDSPREGESAHEWMQRLSSPELQWLDLFHRLTARVEANESRVGANEDQVKRNEQEANRREERLQRKIEFILQQQAQFNADMQRLRELHEQNEVRWARTDEKWERTEESVRALHAIAQIHEREIMAVVESHGDTRERLNALIDTVERVISERRNGGGRREENSQ